MYEKNAHKYEANIRNYVNGLKYESKDDLFSIGLLLLLLLLFLLLLRLWSSSALSFHLPCYSLLVWTLSQFVTVINVNDAFGYRPNPLWAVNYSLASEIKYVDADLMQHQQANSLALSRPLLFQLWP